MRAQSLRLETRVGGGLRFSECLEFQREVLRLGQMALLPRPCCLCLPCQPGAPSLSSFLKCIYHALMTHLG